MDAAVITRLDFRPVAARSKKPLTALGVRIQQRLGELDRTQAWLSRESGIPEGTISKLMTRARKTQSDTLGRLAGPLKVTQDWLSGKVPSQSTASSGRSGAPPTEPALVQPDDSKEDAAMPKTERELVYAMIKMLPDDKMTDMIRAAADVKEGIYGRGLPRSHARPRGSPKAALHK